MDYINLYHFCADCLYAMNSYGRTIICNNKYSKFYNKTLDIYDCCDHPSWKENKEE